MPPDTETTTTFENFGLLVCDTPVLYPFLHSSLTREKNWPREGCSAIGGYLDKQSFYIPSNSSHIHPVTSNTTYRKTPHPQPHTHIYRERVRESTGVGWRVSVWFPLPISLSLGGQELLEPQNHPLNVQLV